ncbi:probable receptor-like protein kinase At1g11050 [Salvia hispanica]|uniref:probable receptor-like protein kinase At1g11050 n=1 Tax=Salvia hispanica TaxID=49212 RepID=UPI002009B531|nr:probable receptor-like protein kinase At1g11050 [Salvia hispanica]
MIPHAIISAIFFFFFTRSSACPLDLEYVVKIPWDTSSCRPSTGIPSPNCCQTLTSLYGVAFAHRLKNTSLFRLPDLETASSCLSNFQSKLDRLALPRQIASACFAPHRFVNTTDVCAGLQTRRDWVALLGESTPLDLACRRDLSDLGACDACVGAGFRAQSRLLEIDGNISHSTGCFHYTILYAAGVVNELGPHSTGALSCIFGLPLLSRGAGGGDRSLILAAAGAGFAAVVVTCLVAFLLKGVIGEKQVAASESDGFPSSDSDSSDDRPLLNWRPKTDTLWYKINDIEKATDNLSPRNLIGRGQFGEVYKGKLGDGSLIAVKKVIDTELEFVSEVEIITSLRHRNLVPLRGCCVDDTTDQKYLIYDYMPNGNLSEHLFPKQRGSDRAMPWPQRKSVILDVANALLYLHRGVNPPVYHRDIKPTNILLDAQMRARVADFGLAKRGEMGEGRLTTRIAGTHGYLATNKRKAEKKAIRWQKISVYIKYFQIQLIYRQAAQQLPKISLALSATNKTE